MKPNTNWKENINNGQVKTDGSWKKDILCCPKTQPGDLNGRWDCGDDYIDSYGSESNTKGHNVNREAEEMLGDNRQ